MRPRVIYKAASEMPDLPARRQLRDSSEAAVYVGCNQPRATISRILAR